MFNYENPSTGSIPVRMTQEQQQMEGALQTSVPPRKRAYNLTNSSVISTTIATSDAAKKRRVTIPSGIGMCASSGQGWWKFGAMQKDVLRELVKADIAATTATSSSISAEEASRSRLPSMYPNLNTQPASLSSYMTPMSASTLGANKLQTSQMLMRAGPLGLHPLAGNPLAGNPLSSNSLVGSSLATHSLNMGFGSAGAFPGALGGPSVYAPSAGNIIETQHPSADEGSAQDDTDDDAFSNGSSSSLKFRAYQAENWTEKFEELIEFRNQYGHCLVPNAFPDNAALAQWVKRQRYQYKLKKEAKRSTMSDERIGALEEIGFVWDSHSAVWEERLNELKLYKTMKGDCNVPSRFGQNRQLAVWVKRQRRQYKFVCEGKASSMTQERISKLMAVGFEWDLRSKS